MKKLIIVLIMAIPIIFLWGCNDKKTVKEDSVKRKITIKEATDRMTKYLDNKYKTRHVVNNVSAEANGNGPFSVLDTISGVAYRSEDPSRIFDVYISFDGNIIKDNYVTIPFAPKVNKIYSDIAKKVWNKINLDLTLGVGETKENWNENSDVLSFIVKESPGIYSKIYIDSKDFNKTIEIENVNRFTKYLKDSSLYGSFTLIYVNNNNFESTINELNKLSVEKIKESNLIMKCVSIDFLPAKDIDSEKIIKAFEK